MTSTPLDRSNNGKTVQTSQQAGELDRRLEQAAELDLPLRDVRVSAIYSNSTGVSSSLKVSQCLNPDCLKLNQAEPEFCQYCGTKLLLQDRYQAIQYLGQGGFARTFAAVDKHRFNHCCLIKQFSKEITPKASKLFQVEAAILKYLGDRPQIPNLLAFFSQEDRVYLIAELIKGQNLLQIQQQTRCFSQSQVQHILRELLPLLEFIHQRQVIHRDIKPSNIIWQEDGSIALIDFGSAILLQPEFQQFTTITGTPGYAAPEQLQGQVYPASDLYSLGATVWQLLTGILPPETGIPSESLWQSTDLVLERDFASIIAKLLQPNWRDRYQSATEVLDALAKTIPHQSKIEILNNNFPEIQYQQLEALLAEQNYLQAEQQTWELILRLAQRELQGCLTLTSLKNFPNSALKRLDFLWRNYSSARFGLSIQKKIYFSLITEKQTDYARWQKFAQQVGWYQEQWLNYSQLNFTRAAPRGHLPVCCIDAFNRAGINRHVCGWWRTGFLTLMEKINF
jgi:serine/threonine protein kinase